MSISSSSLASVYNQLTSFAKLENFWSLFNTVFGSNYDYSLAAMLRSQWQAQDFSELPRIEVISGDILGNARGAYASSRNFIYLSDGFVATASPQALDSVILEEIGHFVDAKVNQTDTAGDEGAIFSALVQEESLDALILQVLRSEDDHVVINWNQQAIQVEKSERILGYSYTDPKTGHYYKFYYVGTNERGEVITETDEYTYDPTPTPFGEGVYIGTIRTINKINDVSLSISPVNVAEDGTQNLVYTFTRTGTLNDLSIPPLYIVFDISGTAVYGRDYTLNGATFINGNRGEIVLEANSATITLTIDPIADAVLESDETVTLTLLTGAGYYAATTNAIIGTITNDDLHSIEQLSNDNVNNSLSQVSGNNVVWFDRDANGYVNGFYFYNGTTTTQVKTYAKVFPNPQTSGNNIVWQDFDGSDYEIYFYNGTTTIQLTNNNTADSSPQISGNNVVWQGPDGNGYGDEIYFYNGTTTTQLTNNNANDSYSSLQISGNNIVWLGQSPYNNYTNKIYFYNGTTTTQLTNDNSKKSSLQISENNVLWRNNNSDTSAILYLYNGTTTTQLSNHSSDRYEPRMSGKNIVWEEFDGNDNEIYFYNGTTITQLTNNNTDDSSPQISGNNVVWQGVREARTDEKLTSNRREIYFYNGTTTTQLTNNDTGDSFPQISGNNIVWYNEHYENGNHIRDAIYFYNGTTILQLTDERTGWPKISEGNIAWEASDIALKAGDPYDIEIYTYTYQINPDLPPLDPNQALPTLAIEDLTITEGDSGTQNAIFTVTRTGTATQPITVNYSTANDTATSDSDYIATSGTLTFATNETTKTITVPIIGDITFEPNETFFVNLTNPSNATITDAQGIGTITNDDVVPTVSVSNAYVSVNSNQNTVIKFKVTLSKPSNQNVTIVYSTPDKLPNSTGQEDAKDYQSITNGTLTFAPGETTKEIAVTVFGEGGVSDQDLEIFAKDTAYRNWEEGQDVDKIKTLNIISSPYDDLGYYVDQVFNDPISNFQAVGLTSNETFSIKLTSANNATIVDGDATGTIYDLGKAPILATRGTKEEQDIFSDANPGGVGFDQYSRNQSAVETWLKKVSQPENGGVIFRPNLTGHSLGGALTQLIAYNYTGNLGKVVTFNSPGVNPSGAPKAGITSTTHYITSSDVVSMAGFHYLPGSYVLSDYSSGGVQGIGNTHLVPILWPRIGYDNTNPDVEKTWVKQPTPLSKSSNLSSRDLSNFFFTYLPDPDYFGFQIAVSLGETLLPPELRPQPISFAQALTFRGTTEEARIKLGTLIYGGKLLLDTIVTISKAASNAASEFSSDKWNQIIQRTKNSLNQPSNNTPLQATSRSVNAFALSISDVSSDIPNDVSSDISSNASNDIPSNVSSDVPSNVSPWDAFSNGLWGFGKPALSGTFKPFLMQLQILILPQA